VFQDTQPRLLMQLFGQLLAAAKPLKISDQRLAIPPNQLLGRIHIAAAQQIHQLFIARTDRRESVRLHDVNGHFYPVVHNCNGQT